jgi:putative ATP-dependent endonuclease of OLD family
MRIKSLQVKNLRSLKDCEIVFGNYTTLVGPNGAGKSNVLCALNIFFRETESASTSMSDLDVEDFHGRDTAEPIEITVTFGDLNEEAQEDFAEYYRQDVLVVTARATFEPVTGIATVKQFGHRRGIEAFRPFFKLYNDNRPAADLKAEYERVRADYGDLPKSGPKDAMRDGVHAYEDQHRDQCTLIASEDQFYGFSKGSDRLARHVQWVYVPAVKDATKENVEGKNTALGKILARTVRARVKFSEEISKLKDDTLTQYRALLEAQQGALNEISNALSVRLKRWANPEVTARLAWVEDAKRSVQVEEPVARLLAGDGVFEGELARFGHGLQRSYLLALLQELASADDAVSPRLILGCEEPELYQHPPQARHLAGILQQLGEANAQIIVSTHSPHFVSGRYFESVRMVRRESISKQSRVSMVRYDQISRRTSDVTGEPQVPLPAQQARLQQALQPHLNEMFFAPQIVFVEGLEDIAYITSWMILSDRWEAFRRHGCHIVPTNGKGYLIEPIIIAQALAIPVFTIFDSDGNKTNAGERKSHERDNRALLTLLGGDPAVPFPDESVWGASFVQWPHNLGVTLKTEVGAAIWDQTFGEATRGLGTPDGSYMKNPVHIGDHLTLLKARGSIPASLDALCQGIIRFSEVN